MDSVYPSYALLSVTSLTQYAPAACYVRLVSWTQYAICCACEVRISWIQCTLLMPYSPSRISHKMHLPLAMCGLCRGHHMPYFARVRVESLGFSVPFLCRTLRHEYHTTCTCRLLCVGCVLWTHNAKLCACESRTSWIQRTLLMPYSPSRVTPNMHLSLAMCGLCLVDTIRQHLCIQKPKTQ